MIDKIGPIVRNIEKNCPECQVDVELNSLEDAYVKIAEDEIAAKEAKNEEGEQTSANNEEHDF